jgi:hypothetical protein
MRTRLCMLVTAFGLAASVTAAVAESTDAPAASTSAQWVTRKLHFMYSPIAPGFVTTHYSCDGLQDQMTSILRQLGASADLSVRSVGCTRASGPEPFPAVDAQFSVLEPAADAHQGAANSPAVAARWEKVTFKPDTSCQLLDQVKRNVLPLFATRNVRADCPVGFTLEVLRPMKAPQPQAAPH